MAVVKSEFFLALNQVATERGISPQDVVDSIKAAVLAAYTKDYGKKIETPEGEEEVVEDAASNLEVKINENSGEMHILEDEKDITPPGFGRIAAQTARQVILQQIREAEKRNIVEHYTGQVGTIIRGRVIRFEGRFVSFDIGKAEGILPVEEQIRSEQYRLNDTLTVYIKEIKEDHFGNSRIILSRAHPDLVKQLFAKEVPEIASGTVKIHTVVREPGDRTKIAVHSDQQGVDPVGACVGQKGIRVKSVTDELGGNEKIDIIQYHEDDETFIREALSPATVQAVKIDKENKRASITVTEEQAPLAIGKSGVNVNLASKLTGYELDIVQTQPTPEEKEAKEKVKQDAKDAEEAKAAEEKAKVEKETEAEVEAKVEEETPAEEPVAEEGTHEAVEATTPDDAPADAPTDVPADLDENSEATEEA